MKLFPKILFLLLITIAVSQNGISQDVEVKTLGKGIVFQSEDNSYSVKLGMRFQSLYLGEWNLDDCS